MKSSQEITQQLLAAEQKYQEITKKIGLLESEIAALSEEKISLGGTMFTRSDSLIERLKAELKKALLIESLKSKPRVVLKSKGSITDTFVEKITPKRIYLIQSTGYQYFQTKEEADFAGIDVEATIKAWNQYLANGN